MPNGKPAITFSTSTEVPIVIGTDTVSELVAVHLNRSFLHENELVVSFNYTPPIRKIPPILQAGYIKVPQ